MSALTATDKYLLKSLRPHFHGVRFNMSAERTGFVDSPPPSCPHRPFSNSCGSHSSILFGVRRCRLPLDFPSCCDVGKRNTHTHTHWGILSFLAPVSSPSLLLTQINVCVLVGLNVLFALRRTENLILFPTNLRFKIIQRT